MLSEIGLRMEITSAVAKLNTVEVALSRTAIHNYARFIWDQTNRVEERLTPLGKKFLEYAKAGIGFCRAKKDLLGEKHPKIIWIHLIR